jgi:hypothetical protein
MVPERAYAESCKQEKNRPLRPAGFSKITTDRELSIPTNERPTEGFTHGTADRRSTRWWKASRYRSRLTLGDTFLGRWAHGPCHHWLAGHHPHRGHGGRGASLWWTKPRGTLTKDESLSLVMSACDEQKNTKNQKEYLFHIPFLPTQDTNRDYTIILISYRVYYTKFIMACQ